MDYDVPDRARLLTQRLITYLKTIEYQAFTSPLLVGAIGGATLLYFSPYLFDDGPGERPSRKKKKQRKNGEKSGKRRGTRGAGTRGGSSPSRKSDIKNDTKRESSSCTNERRDMSMYDDNDDHHSEETDQEDLSAGEEESIEEEQDRRQRDLQRATAELERVTEAKAAALREYGLEGSVDRIKQLMGEFGTREKARRFARIFRLLDWLILLVLLGILFYFIQAQYGFSIGHGWVIFEHYFPREADVIAAFTGRPAIMVGEQGSRHVFDLSGLGNSPPGLHRPHSPYRYASSGGAAAPTSSSSAAK